VRRYPVHPLAGAAPILAVFAILTGCSPATGVSADSSAAPGAPVTPSQTATPTAPASGSAPVASPRHRTETVVTLGDSVPRGTACGCTPFGSIVASRMSRSLGTAVRDLNDSVSGLTSGGLLDMLSSGGSVANDVSRADVVLIEIGANDVSYLGTRCGTGTGCYAASIAGVAANVADILERVKAHNPHPWLQVVLVNYWNVWQDGRVAAGLGSDFQKTSRNVTAAVNASLADVAASRSLSVVDLVLPFLAANNFDDTDLLAADGDHPNASGHLLIANTILNDLPGLLQPLGS
jgi:lysophospholipase L1-like esterase